MNLSVASEKLPVDKSTQLAHIKLLKKSVERLKIIQHIFSSLEFDKINVIGHGGDKLTTLPGHNIGNNVEYR